MSNPATKGVKFTFDTHFVSGETQAEAPARPDARSRKSYTAEEIEAMRAESYAEGLQSGEVRAKQAMAAAVSQISAAVLRVIEAMDGDLEIMRHKAAQFAFAAARHLAGAALSVAPEKEVESVLRQAAHQAVGEPRIVLRLAPHVAEALNDETAGIAHLEGFEGRVQVIADPGFSGADCRVEWRGGGIERLQETVETQLADLIAQRFSLRAEEKE